VRRQDEKPFESGGLQRAQRVAFPHQQLVGAVSFGIFGKADPARRVRLRIAIYKERIEVGRG